MLAGKITGIGLVGLGQLTLAGITALVARAAIGGSDLPTVRAGGVASTLMWFVLGFATFAVLYATFGVLTSRQEDAQTVSVPIAILLFVAYIAALAALGRPDEPLVVAASFTPFIAPFVMPVRVAMGDVPWWQIVLAVSVTVATIYGLVRLAARIYAGAVLRIGPRVGLREAWRSGAGPPAPTTTRS